MEVTYNKLFLKDLKKLKNLPVYEQICSLVFEIIPASDSLLDIPNVKSMKGYADRYRIRIGNYRIGIQSSGDQVQIVRALNRNEIYRYFP